MSGGAEDSEVCLNQSYFQSAEPSTEQVSVTLPPTGVMVLSAVSVGLGLFAERKTKQQL